MLVVTRKRDEAIVIGDGIEITVLRIGRDSVRLGVKAAPTVPVHRREVYDDIRAANAASASDRGGAEAILEHLRVRNRLT